MAGTGDFVFGLLLRFCWPATKIVCLSSGKSLPANIPNPTRICYGFYIMLNGCSADLIDLFICKTLNRCWGNINAWHMQIQSVLGPTHLHCWLTYFIICLAYCLAFFLSFFLLLILLIKKKRKKAMQRITTKRKKEIRHEWKKVRKIRYNNVSLPDATATWFFYGQGKN